MSAQPQQASPHRHRAEVAVALPRGGADRIHMLASIRLCAAAGAPSHEGLHAVGSARGKGMSALVISFTPSDYNIVRLASDCSTVEYCEYSARLRCRRPVASQRHRWPLCALVCLHTVATGWLRRTLQRWPLCALLRRLTKAELQTVVGLSCASGAAHARLAVPSASLAARGAPRAAVAPRRAGRCEPAAAAPCVARGNSALAVRRIPVSAPS